MNKLVAAALTIALAGLQVTVLASPLTLQNSDEAGAQQKVRRAKKKVQDVKCVACLVDIQYLGKPSGPHQQWLCSLHEDSVEKVTGKKMGRGQMKKIEGFEEIIKAHSKEVVSSHTTIVLSEVDVDDAKGTIKIPPGKAISIENGSENGNGNNGHGNGTNKRRLAATGNRTVLVLRINAEDVSTSASAATLSEKVFGTNDDNLATQSDRCSYGELNFVMPDDNRLNNGVYEVTIPDTVNLNEDSTIRNAAIAKATDELGDLESQFDHVMVCIPPGTNGTWIAYGIGNGYMTTYNNQWCTYMSAQMHEIGHNLGLAHSNEGGNTYFDQSGMMGFSYSIDNGPMMCFNGAKSWQLGWYADRRTEVDPIASGWFDQKLVGVANAYHNDAVTGVHYVVVKMETGTTDYYVAFNHVTGINSGNSESGGENRVLVTTQGSGYAESSLVAKLAAGEDYTIEDFNGSGVDIVVVVHSINLSSSPPHALVSIYNPVVPTMSPAPTPTPLSCPNQGKIKVALTTDRYPQETTWTLTGPTELNGGPYSLQNEEFVREECIDPGEYVFTIVDSYGDGSCCRYCTAPNGNCDITLTLDDEVIYSRLGDFGNSDTYAFSVGAASTPSPVSATPNPVVAPTSSPVTSPPTGPPTDPPTESPTAPQPTPSPTTTPPTSRPTLPPTNAPVTSPPTRAPTDPPTTSPTVTYVCADDPTWQRTENKGEVRTCTWVAAKTNGRCNKLGDDGRMSYLGCPESCGQCTS